MTQLVGLLGWPLGHSVSPAMHNAAFQVLGLDWRYDTLPVAPSDLADTVLSLGTRGYRGVNVTIPHKQAVVRFLDEQSAAASVIGAVNTLIVDEYGRLLGDNTDWLGFLHPLDSQGIEVAGRAALLLGAGGSARAVVYALAMRGIARINIWNRNVWRAHDLAAHLGEHFSAVAVTASPHLDELAELPADIVVNTTPLGMWPAENTSPWPDGVPFPQGALVYDLVYRPENTLFLRQARRAACPTQGGLDMLVVQGAEAFQLWTGRAPPLAAMMAAARVALG